MDPLDLRAWKPVSKTGIRIGEQEFQIEWMPGPGFPSNTSSAAAWAGFTGVLLTLLLTGLVVSLNSSEIAALQLVAKKTEDLNLQNAFLHDLMNLSPVGIFRANSLGCFIYTNHRWEEMTGLTSAQSLGAAWMLAIHPEDNQKVQEAWSQLIEGGRFECEFRFLHPKTKRTSWVFCRTVRLDNEQRGASGFLGTVEDVSEIRIQQEQLIESSRLSSLGEMAAGIAHEINNPLAIISGSASLMKTKLERSNFENESIFQYLERIQGTSNQIAKIIRGLRTFAREGSHDPFEWANLESLLDASFELCREKLKVNEVELRFSCDRDFEIL